MPRDNGEPPDPAGAPVHLLAGPPAYLSELEVLSKKDGAINALAMRCALLERALLILVKQHNMLCDQVAELRGDPPRSPGITL